MEDEGFYIYSQGREVARAKLCPRGEGWMTLEEVFVNASARGEGHGRAVCNKALAWCQERNLNVLVTACPIFPDALDEHQLKDFYESLGFKLLTAAPGRYYMELVNDISTARPPYGKTA